MKTIDKIIFSQVAFIVGAIVGYYLFDFEIKRIILNHIVLTIGYLYGFWHSKN